MTTYYAHLNGSGKIKVYYLSQQNDKIYRIRTYTPRQFNDLMATMKANGCEFNLEYKVKEMLKKKV